MESKFLREIDCSFKYRFTVTSDFLQKSLFSFRYRYIVICDFSQKWFSSFTYIFLFLLDMVRYEQAISRRDRSFRSDIASYAQATFKVMVLTSTKIAE